MPFYLPGLAAIKVAFPTLKRWAMLKCPRGTGVKADFFTKYCGPCRRLSPLLEEAESSRSGTLKVVKIDATASPSAEPSSIEATCVLPGAGCDRVTSPGNGV